MQANHTDKRFPWKTAHIRVSGQVAELALSTPNAEAAFVLTLPKGKANLQAWFTDAVGTPTGAFYVSV